jgi:hypothetical protein
LEQLPVDGSAGNNCNFSYTPPDALPDTGNRSNWTATNREMPGPHTTNPLSSSGWATSSSLSLWRSTGHVLHSSLASQRRGTPSQICQEPVRSITAQQHIGGMCERQQGCHMRPEFYLGSLSGSHVSVSSQHHSANYRATRAATLVCVIVDRTTSLSSLPKDYPASEPRLPNLKQSEKVSGGHPGLNRGPLDLEPSLLTIRPPRQVRKVELRSAYNFTAKPGMSLEQLPVDGSAGNNCDFSYTPPDALPDTGN